MIKLSISLMAHPDREHYIPYLKKQLGDVPVSWERGRGIWDTCKRAWLLHDREATHHVVIQDDAIVTDDFIEKAKDVIERYPENTAHIFFIADRAKRYAVLHKDEPGFFTHKIYNEVAICLPTARIMPMLKWCDRLKMDTDKSISRYCQRHRIKIYNPMPSLIEHRADVSIYRTNYEKPEPHAIRRAMWYEGNPKPEYL